MKEKSSFTTEKSIDYTEFKDTYDGNRETANYEEATALPPAKRPDQSKDMENSGLNALYSTFPNLRMIYSAIPTLCMSFDPFSVTDGRLL